LEGFFGTVVARAPGWGPYGEEGVRGAAVCPREKRGVVHGCAGQGGTDLWMSMGSGDADQR